MKDRDEQILTPRTQGSRAGRRRRAKTIATGVGLNNAWLQEQGLLSLKTLWAELDPQR